MRNVKRVVPKPKRRGAHTPAQKATFGAPVSEYKIKPLSERAKLEQFMDRYYGQVLESNWRRNDFGRATRMVEE